MMILSLLYLSGYLFSYFLWKKAAIAGDGYWTVKSRTMIIIVSFFSWIAVLFLGVLVIVGATVKNGDRIAKW